MASLGPSNTVAHLEQLKVNDQMLLQNTDLKSQLKLLRKGIAAKGKAQSVMSQQSTRDLGIARLSQHKESI